MLRPGFADPVLDSQACFRAVLDALSHPGRIATLAALDSPPPLDPATAAVVLTLVDAESPLWLDDAAGAARDWIGFHCGAALVPQARAAFGLSAAATRPCRTWRPSRSPSSLAAPWTA